jgi:hypothetical protein
VKGRTAPGQIFLEGSAMLRITSAESLFTFAREHDDDTSLRLNPLMREAYWTVTGRPHHVYYDLPELAIAAEHLAELCRHTVFDKAMLQRIQDRLGEPRFDTEARTRFLACLAALLEHANQGH